MEALAAVAAIATAGNVVVPICLPPPLMLPTPQVTLTADPPLSHLDIKSYLLDELSDYKY
jgi:hypothetical protein